MNKTYCIQMDGMGCAHCVNSVNEALTAIGAEVMEVKINEARIRFDGDTGQIRDAIEARGFDVLSISEA